MMCTPCCLFSFSSWGVQFVHCPIFVVEDHDTCVVWVFVGCHFSLVYSFDRGLRFPMN